MSKQETVSSSESFVLSEYNRISALQRARLEFIESIFKAYITLTTAIIAVIAVVVPKEDFLPDVFFTEKLLLGLVLVLGILTFFRLVNCNIMLLELTNRLKMLRDYFRDKNSDIDRYIPQEVLDDEQKMSEWYTLRNISKRWLKGGHKGYQVIVALLNSICISAVAIPFFIGIFQAKGETALYLAIGLVMTGAALFLQILYVKKLYGRAHSKLKKGELVSFL